MADIISGNSRFNGEKKAPVKRKIVNINQTDSSMIYDQEDLQNSIRIHRHRLLKRIILIAVIAGVALFAIWMILENRTYSSYSISSSVSRDDTTSAEYMAYQDGYLRYSNDGIAYFDTSGKQIWNQTYTMQKPQVKICDKSIAVGDLNGTVIYLFNAGGKIGKVDTGYTISQIEVASQGVVAAVLEDTNANYINLYNTDGSKIYTVKTTLSGDGYPVDISISDDATKLIASYVYISGEEMKTNVVFYNFSEVGQNENERIVGGFNDFDSKIVGDVQFLSSTTAVAVGEDSLVFYKIKEYPSEGKKITVDNKIEWTFFDESHVGIVEENTASADPYRLLVYNTTGGKVCETTIANTYDQYSFDGNSVIMSGSSSFAVMNLNGKVISSQSTDLPVTAFLSTGKRGHYFLVNSKYIQKIALK